MNRESIDPSEFITSPYRKCPKCGENRFGIWDIYQHHYVRRCKNCLVTSTIKLPILKKKIIYLDQFVISNMMKAINPQTEAHQAGRVDPYWRTLFEKINSLCKLQVVICPDSLTHRYESMVTPYYSALKQMYEVLSHGVTFKAPYYIRQIQVFDHAKWWIDGQVGHYAPNLNPDRVLNGPIDAWHSTLQLSVTMSLPDDALNQLRSERGKISNAQRDLFTKWQGESDKKFKDWYWKEIREFGRLTLRQYIQHLMKIGAIHLGISTIEDIDSLMSPELIMIQTLHNLFMEKGVAEEQLWQRLLEYFESDTLESIPFCKIQAMLWAAIARKAASGQRNPPNRGTANDINLVSTLLPYCDTMFIDKEMHSYLMEEPLRSELNSSEKVFSLRTKNEFLGYLEKIREEIPREHWNVVDEVYGPQWQEPFISMYDRAE